MILSGCGFHLIFISTPNPQFPRQNLAKIFKSPFQNNQGISVKNTLLAISLLLTLAEPAFAQEEQGVSSTTTEKSYLLDSIQVTDEKDKKEKSYESIHSETVIPKAAITKGNTRDVSEVLQKVPGVSVTGGSEGQNKKVSIRGLDGYRVIQKVDGAERQESTQSGQSSGVFVEPEMLSEIQVQNGADSVGSINGAIGGAVMYKTITPEDILLNKQKTSTKVKVGGDSATEGLARSVHAAAKVSENSSVLAGVTLRNSNKIESGSPSEAGQDKETENAESTRSTYLGKYVRKTDSAKTDIKLEYSDAQSKKAAYLAGAGGANSDYQATTVETVISHEQSINSNFRYEALTYFNKTEASKNTHTAYRGMAATLGQVDDQLENAGVKLSGISMLPLSSAVVFQSKNGVEGFNSKIAEDDGTSSPYFGESQGFDAGVFSENSLSFYNDTVVVMAGGRYTNYHRQSDKLALDTPSKDDNTLSSMVGVSYAPFDWMKVSAKYANSNRAPNVREMYYGSNQVFRCHRPSKACTEGPNPNLNEETAYSREVSVLFKIPETTQPRRLKVTYFDENINDYIDRMAFMYHIENGQKIPAGPSTATNRDYTNRNLSTVLRRGVEAQAQVEQGNWQYDAMYSTVRMDCRGCPDMFTATTVNEPFYAAPANKFGVGAGYEFTSLKLQVGADAQFVSAQRDLSERYLLAGYGTPAYDVYGLNMRWSPKVEELAQFELGLGISNLFDRSYVVHNSPTGTFELGRNYSLSVAAIF